MSEYRERTLVEYFKDRADSTSKEAWRVVGEDAEANPLPNPNQLCLIVVKSHRRFYEVYEVARFDLNGWEEGDDYEEDEDHVASPLECGFIRNIDDSATPMHDVVAWLPLPEPTSDGWEMYDEESTEDALRRASCAVDCLVEHVPDEVRQFDAVRMFTDYGEWLRERFERQAEAYSVVEEPTADDEDTFQ